MKQALVFLEIMFTITPNNKKISNKELIDLTSIAHNNRLNLNTNMTPNGKSDNNRELFEFLINDYHDNLLEAHENIKSLIIIWRKNW